MPKLYRYVGPEEIARRVARGPVGTRIQSPGDLANWIRRAGQEMNQHGLLVLTFVIDEDGFFCVADRHSEHVACAGGGPVRSAGEITLRHAPAGWAVEEVSNQSTGYCPEPESWPEVAAALEGIGLPHPGRFTTEFVFRRCPACGQRNVVKDGWFFCGVCGGELPTTWNFS